MYGKAQYDYIRVIEAATYAGEYWLQVDCGVDYEDFKALPTVIEFEGRLYGKMSWNSDTRKAAYKVGAPVAKDASRYTELAETILAHLKDLRVSCILEKSELTSKMRIQLEDLIDRIKEAK